MKAVLFGGSVGFALIALVFGLTGDVRGAVQFLALAVLIRFLVADLSLMLRGERL